MLWKSVLDPRILWFGDKSTSAKKEVRRIATQAGSSGGSLMKVHNDTILLEKLAKNQPKKRAFAVNASVFNLFEPRHFWLSTWFFAPRFARGFGYHTPGSLQVNRLLSNVAYEYPGPQCRENVYAYVHPNPPHNKRLGRWTKHRVMGICFPCFTECKKTEKTLFQLHIGP